MTDSPYSLPERDADAHDEPDTPAASSDKPSDPSPAPWWRADPTGSGSTPAPDAPLAHDPTPPPDSPSVPDAPSTPTFTLPESEPDAELEPERSASFSTPEPEPEPELAPIVPAPYQASSSYETTSAHDIVATPGTSSAPSPPLETYRPKADPVTPVPLPPASTGPRPSPPRSPLAPARRTSSGATEVPRLGGVVTRGHARDLPNRGRAAIALLSVSVVMGVVVALVVSLTLFVATAALQRALG